MSKRFVFVSGDRGAALAQLPVAHELRKRGHIVQMYADVKGLAAKDIASGDLEHVVVAEDYEHFAKAIRGDVMVVGTSASATALEHACALCAQVPVVLASDGLFNHALPLWRDIRQHRWFAIDDPHAQAIRALRPSMDPQQVLVTGQPAFDTSLELMPRKQDIRKRIREDLNLGERTFLLWWSQGMPEVIEEDELMIAHVLQGLSGSSVSFAARLHPKLDKTVRPGYVCELRGRIGELSHQHGIQLVSADVVPGEQLCLAADVILSITCTEDIKSTLIGGPPVVHFLGPRVQEWMRQSLFLDYPYLPDVAAGLSLAAFSVSEAPGTVARALRPDALEQLRKHWQPPQGLATQRTADILEELA